MGFFSNTLPVASLKPAGILPCFRKAFTTPPTPSASSLLVACMSQGGQRSSTHGMALKFPRTSSTSSGSKDVSANAG